MEKGSTKVELPQDLKKTLLLTNERLIKETAEAKKNQSDLEVKLSGQEQQVKTTYEKGRALFLSGRIKDAVLARQLLRVAACASFDLPQQRSQPACSRR